MGTLTGQHEAWVLHLNPLHLGLQEELEINASGLGGVGEKSGRDPRSVFVVLLTKAQTEEDIFCVFLHLVQNLRDAEKREFGYVGAILRHRVIQVFDFEKNFYFSECKFSV